MTNKSIIKSFKKYQKASPKKRSAFLRAFEKRMIYRTTKTENPETTRGLVERILLKLKTLT